MATGWSGWLVWPRSRSHQEAICFVYVINYISPSPADDFVYLDALKQKLVFELTPSNGQMSHRGDKGWYRRGRYRRVVWTIGDNVNANDIPRVPLPASLEPRRVIGDIFFIHKLVKLDTLYYNECEPTWEYGYQAIPPLPTSTFPNLHGVKFAG